MATPVAAQESEGSPDIVVTGAPLDRPQSAMVQSVSEVRVRDIPLPPRLEDSLRNVAGLTQFRRSDSRSANATSQGATLRGLGGNASSRALLLLDGVPQTDPFGGWVTWPAYAPQRLALITITTGGGSASVGPGALAGTIEMQSIGSSAPTRLALDYGSRNAIEGSATLTGKLGEGFGFINASYSRGDGFIPIVSSARGPADIAAPYEQWSVAARGVAPLDADTELQASALAFHDRRTRGTILSSNGGDGADASLRLVHRGHWQAEALAYLQLRKFQSRFVAIDTARATVTQTVDQYNVPSTGAGMRFEVRPPLGAGTELRLGGEWRHVVGETNELFTYVTGLPTRGREAGGASDTMGGFAEATLVRNAITFSASGRLDHWSIRNGRLIERTLSTGALIRNERPADRQGWEPTGRFGLVYETGPVSLRTAAYLGWRLPTLNELYRPFRVGADATAANPALSPERMRGAEVGVNLKTGDRGWVKATAFSNRLVRPISNVTLGAGPGVFPGVGFVAAGGAFRQRQNLDAITSQGLEFEIWQRWGDAMLRAAYAYTDARVKARGAALPLDGLRPAQVPKHMANATLRWKQLSGTVRYVSGQFEDDLNTRALNDALTFDADAYWPLTDQLTLSLRAENIANARVESAISGTGVIERASPRSFWIGLRWRGNRR
jgi:outer membrane receptor protein involved in Fe transport